MEYEEGGTLGDILENHVMLSEENTRIIIEQLLLTVDFMSRKGIIHRDLKPENVLLNSKAEGVYDVRIADFGFATKVMDQNSPHENESKTIVCGTPGYIAPEAIAGKGCSLKSDIFSVGSILFNMLTLKNLFSGSDYKTVMLKNRDCDWDNLSQRLRNCSNHAKDLVM